MIRRAWAWLVCGFLEPRCQAQGFCSYRGDCPWYTEPDAAPGGDQ